MGLWDKVKRTGSFLANPLSALEKNGPLGFVQDNGGLDQQRSNLDSQGNAAGSWADEAQNNARGLGAMSSDQYNALGRQASGQDSISREMLRQGLQQQYGQQRSMAAGASPQNAAMAARTGATQMGRAATGMAGQAAVAGMQEQMAARQAQSNFLQNWRNQELQAAQGGRGSAISAYGGGQIDKPWIEKYGSAVSGGAGMAAMSDRRLKTEIKDGDASSKAITDKLKAYSYRYKDEKHGKGSQHGVMAQDLEDAGLGHAIIETPEGKAVHGAKAALSGLALTAALARRVSKLEGGK